MVGLRSLCRRLFLGTRSFSTRVLFGSRSPTICLSRLARISYLLLVALRRWFLDFSASCLLCDSCLSLAFDSTLPVNGTWVADVAYMEFGNDECGIIARYVLPGIAFLAEDCVPVVLVILAETPYLRGVVVGRGVLERRGVGDGSRARWMRVDSGHRLAMLEISRRVDRGYFCHNPINEVERGCQWQGRDQFSPFCVAYRREHPGYCLRPGTRWLSSAQQCKWARYGRYPRWSRVSRGAVVSLDRRSRSASVNR